MLQGGACASVAESSVLGPASLDVGATALQCWLHFCPPRQKRKLKSIFSVCRVPCRNSSRRTSSLNRSWTNCETSSGRSTPCWPSGAETPRAGRRSGLGRSPWTGHHRPAEDAGSRRLRPSKERKQVLMMAERILSTSIRAQQEYIKQPLNFTSAG